ncbi:hypothetical protein NECAME_14007, partial [Necator americanus]
IFSLSEDGRIKACKTEQTGKLVEGRHSVYRICASNSDDLNAWLEVIAGAVTHYPTRPRIALNAQRSCIVYRMKPIHSPGDKHVLQQ